MVSPVNDPLTEDLVSTGVGEADGVFVAALFVAVELLEVLDDVLELFEVAVEEFFDFEVVFFFTLVAAFLAVTFAAPELVLELVLELALAAGAAACVVVEAAAVEVVWLFKVAAEAPAIVPRLLLDNCGGVTDKTAPRPPTVPPAINNARFIPFPFPYPRVSNKTFELITELNCPNLRST